MIHQMAGSASMAARIATLVVKLKLLQEKWLLVDSWTARTDGFTIQFNKCNSNKLGLSWTKLNQSCDCCLIKICLDRAKISLSKYLKVVLKLTDLVLTPCI